LIIIGGNKGNEALQRQLMLATGMSPSGFSNYSMGEVIHPQAKTAVSKSISSDSG
jgi:hypothetical protein